MKNTITRARELATVNDENVTHQMLEKLVSLPREMQRWLYDNFSGNLCVFDSPEWPNRVIEYVFSDEGDSVTTLFEGHPTFNSLGELQKIRTELIQEIAQHYRGLPNMIALNDEGRGRLVMLREMSTAQLADVHNAVVSNSGILLPGSTRV